MKLNQSLRKAHEDFRQWRYESYIGDGTEETAARGFAQKDAEHFIETLRKYVDIYQRREFYDRYLHVMYETDDEIAALKSATEYCDIVSSNIVDSTIDVILNCCTDYYPEEIDYAIHSLIPCPDRYLSNEPKMSVSAGETVCIPCIELECVYDMIKSELIDESIAAYLLHTTEETLQLLLKEYDKSFEEDEPMTPVTQE